MRLKRIAGSPRKRTWVALGVAFATQVAGLAGVSEGETTLGSAMARVGLTPAKTEGELARNLALLKERLAKREEDLLKEAEKMKELYREGIISRLSAQKSKEVWEAAKAEREQVEKQIAEATATPPATVLTQSAPSSAAIASVSVSPTTTTFSQPADAVPDIAGVNQEILKTQAAIAEQETTIQELKDALRKARQQIAAVKQKLDVMIAQARSRRQRVHPLIVAADDYLNVPYLWGGTTSRGLDCSGLVYRALARLGIPVPHSAALLAQRGKPVSVLALRPGDLIFFANTYKPGVSHVGIYLGGDSFLHASSGAGRVTIGSLRDQYFLSHFAGARRIVQ